MAVDIVVEAQAWETLAFKELFEAAINAALSALKLSPGDFDIVVLACDDTRIAALNADFRSKDRATNVLSWPSAERAAQTPGDMPIMPVPGPDVELGDIAISFDTCAREAAAQDKPLADHVTHLIVHGTLHLLGFDHENDPDAALMEQLEVDILGQLGLPDPYNLRPVTAGD